MRWHVIYDGQPKLDIQDVYAHSLVTAAEIVAEVHGVTGMFKARQQDTPHWSKVIVNKNTIYVGHYGGSSEPLKFGKNRG